MAEKTETVLIASFNIQPKHINESSSSRHIGVEVSESYVLVWLDPKINEFDTEYQNSIEFRLCVVRSQEKRRTVDLNIS